MILSYRLEPAPRGQLSANTRQPLSVCSAHSRTYRCAVRDIKATRTHTHARTQGRVREPSASRLYLNQKQIKTDAMATLIEKEYSALQLTRRLLLLKQLRHETHSTEARRSPATPSNRSGPERCSSLAKGFFFLKISNMCTSFFVQAGERGGLINKQLHRGMTATILYTTSLLQSGFFFFSRSGAQKRKSIIFFANIMIHFNILHK